MKESKKLEVVVSSVCPYGQLIGDDADGCRANPLDDGRIFNLLACRISTQVSPSLMAKLLGQGMLVRLIVAELISTSKSYGKTFSVGHVTTGQGEGVVAHGLSPEDIMTTVGLVCDDVTVEISYSANDVQAACEVPDQDAIDVLPVLPDGLEAAETAFDKLTTKGFRLIGKDLTSAIRYLNLHKGHSRGQKVMAGVRASIRWTV